MQENLKVFKVTDISPPTVTYHACTDKYHYAVVYNTIHRHVCDTIKNKCDGTCKNGKELEIHQFIRDAIKKLEFMLDSFNEKRRRKK